jgi:hypothetical protein
MPSPVKPPKGGVTVQVRLPKRHSGQQRIHDNAKRFTVIMCGRRFGKTKDGCRWIADGALKGERCGWFAPDYKILGDAWRELLEWLGPMIASKNESEKRIELVNGAILEFWTLDSPDAGRSRKYHRVVIDEAGLVSSLMERWSQAIRPALADYQGSARFYGTPKGSRSAFTALFNRGLDPNEPDWASFRAPTTENPYIAPEEIEAAKRDMTPEEWLQEFGAVPMESSGNPFGLDALKKCTGDLSKEPPMVYGADLARAVDYTVLIGLDAWGRVCRIHRWQGPWATTKAKIAELEQENESLRESLKEYKESFKILRKQINEVQTFNAKLAYVNKLFSKGGLTNEEKIKIAEDFDRTNNAEEAKVLFNKIISENKEFKDGKTDKLRNKLKSATPAATPSTQTETLYESKEMSRMKLLAGIKYNTSEK